MNGFKRFMYGRYGWDRLNWLLIILTVVLGIISRTTMNMAVTIAALLVFGWCLFRALSKNVERRYDENYKFVNFLNSFKERAEKKRIYNAESVTHHHLECPSCAQKIKVPRNRGKIEIICPKCKTTFYKNT